MFKNHAVVAVYKLHSEAIAAIAALQNSGFSFSLTGQPVGLSVGRMQGAGMISSVSGMDAELYTFGLPMDNIQQYEMALRIGMFIVITYGTQTDAKRAYEILNGTNPESLQYHIPSGVSDEASVVRA